MEVICEWKENYNAQCCACGVKNKLLDVLSHQEIVSIKKDSQRDSNFAVR